MKRALLVALTAALVAAAPAAAFTPADPLAANQWYLAQDHAFDAWPTPPPTLAPVKVAIVDSGIDNTLPDFAGQIADARSFVGGSPYVDTEGHGTFVAGEIAAKLDSIGIAGMAYASQLLVAKVVKPDGSIPLTAESDAIRWAADSGAKVINLSLGGLRDPLHPSNDYYSTLEAGAIRYAVKKGVVIVAAVGNSDEAPSSPWNYASYPAALPHVVGVSALKQNGDVAGFSNRDPIFNDISAPGVGIFSTFPLALTGNRPSCTDQGYSDCGGPDYFNAEGTSFAAPQVSAAAAMLFAVDAALTSSQVAAILEQSADDVNATNGCAQCTVGHDRFSGWGRLDVARAIQALQGPLPAPDKYEPNDDAGTQATQMWGKTIPVSSTLDYYDDPVDVYKVALAPREQLKAKLTASWTGADVGLVLWRPGTVHVAGGQAKPQLRAAQSVAMGAVQQVTYRSKVRGWYYVEVKAAAPGSGPYTLSLTKTTQTR
jgi:subtilisin family serine protease